ncbi:sugar transferase, partial [Streptomyces sp. NPDC056254]
MDSAPARHTGQGGTGPGGSAFAPAPHAAARRSATAIHPPRGPRAEQARSAVRPRRVRRGSRVLPLLTADALAAVVTAATLPGPALHTTAAAPVLAALPALLVALHAQAGLYRPRLAPSAVLELPALVGRSAVLWCAAAAVTAALAPARAMGWSVLLTAVCLQTVLVCAGRGVANQLHRRAALRRPASTLVVGPGAGAAAVAAALHNRPEYGLRP